MINCAGNGGMLCVDDATLARRAKLLRSWGRSSSLFDLEQAESIEVRFDVELGGIPYDRKFVFEEPGYNYEPSELGAAFGLVQLAKLEANIEAQRRNFATHVEFFGHHEDIFILPREIDGARTGWLAFPLTLREDASFSRRDFQLHLEQRAIQTRTVFAGNVLRQPLMVGRPHKEAPAGYPESDKVMRGGVMIGCHHGLGGEQIAHLHATVATFLGAATG